MIEVISEGEGKAGGGGADDEEEDDDEERGFLVD
jgi:hypothetical protein